MTTFTNNQKFHETKKKIGEKLFGVKSQAVPSELHQNRTYEHKPLPLPPKSYDKYRNANIGQTSEADFNVYEQSVTSFKYGPAPAEEWRNNRQRLNVTLSDPTTKPKIPMKPPLHFTVKRINATEMKRNGYNGDPDSIQSFQENGDDMESLHHQEWSRLKENDGEYEELERLPRAPPLPSMPPPKNRPKHYANGGTRAFNIKEIDIQTNEEDNLNYVFDQKRSVFAAPGFEIDILMIGKTGNGKSALGNSLLGRNVFLSKPSSISVTSTISRGQREYNGILINVVDGPGVCETRLDDEKAINMIVRALSQAVTLNPTGYHAFLLVVRFGGRFTKEDQITVDVLKKIFGKSFVRKFGILVMTYGDQFEKDVKESFDEWIFKEEGLLAKLVEECDKRVILYDNKTEDVEKKDKQMRNLLEMIQMMILKNCRYTDEQFEMARSGRDAIVLENKKQVISDDVLNKASSILDELKICQDQTGNRQIIYTLQELLARADELHGSIVEQDNRTGVLQDLINHVQSVYTSIANEIQLVQRFAEMFDKYKTMRLTEEKCKGLPFEVGRHRNRLDQCDAEKGVNGTFGDFEQDNDLTKYREQEEQLNEDREIRNEETKVLVEQLQRIRAKNNQNILTVLQNKLFSAFKSKITEKTKKRK